METLLKIQNSLTSGVTILCYHFTYTDVCKVSTFYKI